MLRLAWNKPGLLYKALAMPDYRISHPSKKLRGRLLLPGSKSESNRLLILKALYAPNIELAGLSESSDTQVLLKALENFEYNSQLNIKDAGTAMRFLTAFLAIQDGEWTLSGTARMHQRPIGTLVEALNALGAKIEYLEEEGYPPLKIKGAKLKGSEIWVDASQSSQFISALMLIAPSLPQGLSIKFKGASVSAPYIYLTANIMRSLGFQVYVLGDEVRLDPQSLDNPPTKHTIEPDWSAVSYWFSALSLAQEGELYFPGFREISFQGDSILHQFYAPLGVEQFFIGSGMRIRKSALIPAPPRINLLANPDLAQSLVPAYAAKEIGIEFQGLQTLRIKETDRIQALIKELTKLGVSINLEGDNLLLGSGFKAKEVQIESYKDHRMAMGFLALALLHPIIIKDVDVVQKSYPQFWEHCRLLGFEIEEI